MISEENYDFRMEAWREHPYFRQNQAVEYLDMISEKIDGLMETLGYRHEGVRFLCGENTDRTVALFSHGGSGACVLAHLLALPFPYVCTVLPYDFTSVIILEFPDRPGRYFHPRLELFNDIAHIRKDVSGVVFQQEPDRK